MTKGKLGEEVVIVRPLDRWVAEAEESTARVFDANLNGTSVALKIMTPAWIFYSLPKTLVENRISKLGS